MIPAEAGAHYLRSERASLDYDRANEGELHP